MAAESTRAKLFELMEQQRYIPFKTMEHVTNRSSKGERRHNDVH